MYIISRMINNNSIRKINNNNSNNSNNSNNMDNAIKSFKKSKIKCYIQETVDNMMCAGYEQQAIDSYQERVNIDMLNGNYINIIKRSLMINKLIRDADYI